MHLCVENTLANVEANRCVQVRGRSCRVTSQTFGNPIVDVRVVLSEAKSLSTDTTMLSGTRCRSYLNANDGLPSKYHLKR